MVESMLLGVLFIVTGIFLVVGVVYVVNKFSGE